MDSSRRRFLHTAALAAAATVARRSPAQEIVDGELAHPVEPPKALEFSTLGFTNTAFYGGPSTAIVAMPKGLAPGERVPLVVLLPGGHHNMQGHVRGCWGWWSEYQLGAIDTALRRGNLTDKDLQKLARPEELEEMNRLLALKPYRGAALVTPWVVGRQLDPAPHGAQVAAFLRVLLARVREEFPVALDREATGLGGMSSGGLWAIHAGSTCADLFGTVIATQPFTEELVPPLLAVVKQRARPQRLRMVTSVDDHQRKTTVELYEKLRAADIEVELAEYLGAHSAAFAAGPGGFDALLHFDRALRGEQLDGTRPLPSRDGLIEPLSFGDDAPKHVAPPEPTESKRSRMWPLAAVGVAGVGAALALSARKRRA